MEHNYVTKFRCHYQIDLLGQIPERKILYAISSPTQPLPSQTPALCYCADQVPRASQKGLSSQSQTIAYVQLWLLSQTVHWKGIRAVVSDFLMLRPSECSWAIVFHKGQNQIQQSRPSANWRNCILPSCDSPRFLDGSDFPRSLQSMVQRCLVWKTYGVKEQVKLCWESGLLFLFSPFTLGDEPAPESFSPIMGQS